MTFRIATKIALMAFFLVLVMALTLGWLSIEENREIVRGLEEQKLANATHLMADQLKNSIDELRMDIWYLGRLPEIYRVLRAMNAKDEIDPQTKATLSDAKDQLAKVFHELLQARTNYLQVRYLNAKGWEIVRVHREVADSKEIERVKEEKLADKCESGYFTETKKRDVNEVYLSEIELNKEQGKVQIPYTPVLRAAQKLTLNEKFQGIIIINQAFEPTIYPLLKESQDLSLVTYLTNDKGAFLVHPEPEQCWTFSLDRPLARLNDASASEPIRNFFTDTHAEKTTVDWTMQDSEGELNLMKVPFDPDRSERFLVVGQAANSDKLLAGANQFRQNLLLSAGWLLVVATLLAFIFSSVITRGLKKITQATERIAKGEYEFQALPTKSRDEIGLLATRFQHMAEQVRERNELLEQRVHERTASLEQRTNELASAKDATDAAMKAQEEFMNNVAHDLRTPLTIVIGFSEDLLNTVKEKGPEDYVEDLTLIVNRGNDLLELINDMLNMSRVINDKQLQLEEQDFDVQAILQERIAGMDHLAKQYRNKIELHCAPDLGVMRGDEARVWRILMNLLTNSCKFTRRGLIQLKALREHIDGTDWIVFQVIDNGKGMNREQQQLLFKRFAQVHEKGGRVKGIGSMGLGLSICALYCEAMKGQIGVESEPGKGSTFTVRLPVNREETKATPLAMPKSRKVTDADKEAANLVLIIDDDASVCELMKRNLTEGGLSSQSASTGEEGLRLAKELLPSAIVLDVVLPGIDGWSVLAALKTDPSTAKIPVIMASMLDEKQRGIDLGADEYVTKPIRRERLLDLIHKHLAEVESPRVLIVEDDPDMLKRLSDALKAESWEVMEALNGHEAVALLSEPPPDLILLDLILPGIDGFQVLEQIRKTEAWETTPVLVMTNAELDEASRQQLQGKVQQVLSKSLYGRDELLREIHTLVETKP